MADLSKPISCSKCEKSFPSMKALYGHMRTHSQRKLKEEVHQSETLRRREKTGSTTAAPPAPSSPAADVDLLQCLSGSNWSVTRKRSRRGDSEDPELEALIEKGVDDLMMLAFMSCREFHEIHEKEESKKRH